PGLWNGRCAGLTTFKSWPLSLGQALSRRNAPGSQTPYLKASKDEFVSREGDRVKNRYVAALGFRALLIGGSFMAAYILIRWLADKGLLYDYRSFFVMAAASCVGTWLSFSLRRAVLGFADLASLEEDRLNPTGRLFFVIGLTSVIGIFIS